MVLEAYQKSRKTYGYRRIQIWIEKEHGIKINHKSVLRLIEKAQYSLYCQEKKSLPTLPGAP